MRTVDSTKPPVSEPDALAITREFARKVDSDPKLQRAIQKAIKQMKEADKARAS